VLSLIVTILGAVTAPKLPIAQYPEITPPTVQVSCTYPGANAQVVADTVAAPIEQQVNGIKPMIYMSSQCTNDGAYSLTVTFDVGADVQMALVQVQNRVQLAMPQLPQEVQNQGITIKKKAPSILLAITFYSPDGRYDAVYLSNYATIFVQDELFRLYGVGDIGYLGQREYSIRAWLDPDQLAARNITASEVAQALKQQNIAVSTGLIGQEPAPPGQALQLTMTTLGRLTTPEQFGDVILKTGNKNRYSPDTPVVRLRDVARLELGAQSYDQIGIFDGQSAVSLGIYQLPGTNALQTAEGIRAKMEELSRAFPDGVAYTIAYDTTPFIQQSIIEVLETLRDAIILVAIVVLVFLQNWRAAIIPLVAVPVALFGTFAAMGAFGFSLNNLSLFGLVLAIGIVVDDAIVVVENVERWLAQGLPPREAAAKAMEEVTGPVVAVALVLSAVFVPCAFIAGITGQFFRQFALTITVSTIISALNSLTLSPVLAALLLRHHAHGPRDVLPRPGIILAAALAGGWLLPAYLPHWSILERVPLWGVRVAAALLAGLVGGLLARGVNWLLGGFFALFNRSFDFSTGIYTRLVGGLLRGSLLVLLVYGGLLYGTYWLFNKVPIGFIPPQDKGYLLVNVQLPDSASVQRTAAVMDRIDQIARSTPGIAHTVGVSGQSIVYQANSPNWASMFVILDSFEKRNEPHLHGPAISAVLRERLYKEIQEAQIMVFGPPPVDGLGTAGGFKLMIEDRGNVGLDYLQQETDALVRKSLEQPDLFAVSTVFRARTPQLFVDIDRARVRAHGVEIKDVFDTLQVYMGSMYINQFNDFGRSWQVNIQADGTFRNSAAEVARLKVRNSRGQMVPLGALADIRDVGGPVMVLRYNLYPSAPINGIALPWISSGQAVDIMEGLAGRELPPTMAYQWTELTFLQLKAERGTDFQDILSRWVFELAVVLVFLVLAAQYESWTLPLAVILVVPMCLLCAAIGVALKPSDINVFTQIGLVVLVGLASKNAILIVEFAKQQREAGVERRQATLEACRLRLRPIVMTSFAFILGVVPLVLAEGAGAEMRQALGVAVFSGMLGVTLFGIFLTPVFFYVIEWLAERRTHP
jgi:multidrug efflux pump subunit AcrB